LIFFNISYFSYHLFSGNKNFYLECKPDFFRGVIISQYDLNEIIQKIKQKSPFELKGNERSRPSSLRVIVSKLFYSQDYKNEPQETRKKVTQLLLYHGQFSREEIDEIFQLSAKETTDYSLEFLKTHPEVAMTEAKRNKEFPEENEGEEGERPKEIKYIFPHYG
jgi:hypothetical protein